MNSDRKQWVLIQRYVTGNAGPAERQSVESWMAEAHENRRIIQEVREVWNQTPSENFDVDIQHAWEQFEYRNREKANNSTSFGYSHWKPGISVYLLRTAAVLLVGLCAWLFVQYTNTMEQMTSEQALVFNVLQELETDNGEKARVTFSDGTRVILNSASSLRFPEKFHGPMREVYLEGEAYFEVAHDADNPFIVYNQDAEVKVLGTKFNVRGWNEDSGVKVVVQEGKVAVGTVANHGNNRSPVVLTKGLYSIVKKGGRPSPAQNTNVSNHLRWIRGGLHFENVPFRRVILDIERRFNVNIEVNNTDLMEIPYTGTFQYAELDEVLTVIVIAMGIEFERNGSEVIFN